MRREAMDKGAGRSLRWALVGVLGALLVQGAGCSEEVAGFAREDGGASGGDAAAMDAGARCNPGVDSDFDGANDDAECAAGTDSRTPDTDNDGLRDGAELNYPRVCVAADRGAQRRPLAACTGNTDCAAGEACQGLDARRADSDGDGLNDGQEDPNGDGVFAVTRGETDPRLWDSDGDGRGDLESDLAICRRGELIEPERVLLPGGTFQLGLDPRWRMNTRRSMTDGGASALVLDDVVRRVAAVAIERPSRGADVRAEATAVEAAVVSALGAVPILVGQSITTHEMLPAVNSLYRVPSGELGALRDALRTALAPGGDFGAAVSYGLPGEAYVEITTVFRSDRMKTAVLATVIAASAANDPTQPASIVGDDLSNTTGLAESDRLLDSACQRFTADRESAADFLWLVDTSGSMSDDQERLGRTAQRFFAGLDGAGVDFRVGVFEAGSGALDLDQPGFRFIQGADPGGARMLAWQVTYTTFMTDRRDTFAPYRFPGGQEEPLAAAVISYEALRRRGEQGELDPDRRLRDNATTVAFFVTDEPGSNDDTRYFARDTARWGATYPERLRGMLEFLHARRIQTYGLVADYRTNCAMPNVQDFPKCVILGNGGAFIPITTATDAEVMSAMARIVDAVAGATSQFVLERTPVSSTLQVRVGGRAVPRSRVDGFDYDPAARAVVFYGTTYRPRRGTDVVVSYRVWAGSLG
jgi:hypothetical protein